MRNFTHRVIHWELSLLFVCRPFVEGLSEYSLYLIFQPKPKDFGPELMVRLLQNELSISPRWSAAQIRLTALGKLDGFDKEF